MTRKPTLFQALIPFIGLALLLIIGYGRMGIRAEVLFLLAAAISAAVGKWVGVSWEEMLQGIKDKLNASIGSILIMVTVGLMIGIWMAAGTIPLMIYYGLKVIDPRFLLATALVATALVSTFTGTSFGSAGTIGVAIMGVAIGLNMSLPMTAGAVISGAYFGDKLSPLSDTTNLAPAVAQCDLYDHVKHMLWTTVPAFTVALIFFLIIGYNGEASSSPEKVASMLAALEKYFNLNPVLLLPPIIIIIGAILKKPTIPVMLTSAVVAGILALVFQGMDLKNMLNTTVYGYNVSLLELKGIDISGILAEIPKLLNRGGMRGFMSGVVLLIICAFSFGGVISAIGCLDVILEKLKKLTKTTTSLISTTIATSILVAIATGSSYLAILIPGDLYRPVFKERGLAMKNLSRTLEDSGTVVVPLVPWSIAGAYMAGTLGVDTVAYAPWAVFCYTGFIFAIILAVTGKGIAKAEEKINA